MDCTQRLLQRILDSHYQNVQIKRLNHCSRESVFMVTTPYVNTLHEHIILTLYYDHKNQKYVLSDDGYSLATIDVGHNKEKRKILTKLKHKMKYVSFNRENQSFQCTFSNIRMFTKAYYYLTRIILNLVDTLDTINA